MSSTPTDSGIPAAVLGARHHAPSAATPVEITEELGVSRQLLALTQEAAVWASRAPRQSSPAVHPDVEFSVHSDSDITLYTPDGTSPTLFWKSPLLSPPGYASDYPGDAGGFTRGVRGIHSALPVGTEEARLAAIAGMSAANPLAPDFSAKLTPDSAVVNIWRFGPGAFAVDICVGAETQDFNRELGFNIRVTHPANLHDAYVPAGGFYRPIGGKVTLRRVSNSEIAVGLDLRRAELRNTFLRVIVAWELAVTGDNPQQCLVAMKAPRALAAPPEGAVLAGGSVVGNRAYPISSALNYGFCNFAATGVAAATSPEGHGVLVGEHRGNSALFGDGSGCVLSVSDLQVEAEAYTVMLNFIAVGDWRGNSDPRSVLKLEANIDGSTWVPIADYSFSNDKELTQSYPATAGKGEYAAMTARGRINRYQFGDATPMLTTLPSFKTRPVAVIPVSEYAPVTKARDVQEDVVIPDRGTEDAQALLYRQFGIDVRGVELPDAYAPPVFTALPDTEYRLSIPVRTNAKAFSIRLSASKAWALSSVQLWSEVSRINVPVAGSNDTAGGIDDNGGDELRTETTVIPPAPELLQKFHLIPEAVRRLYLDGEGGPWDAEDIITSGGGLNTPHSWRDKDSEDRFVHWDQTLAFSVTSGSQRVLRLNFVPTVQWPEVEGDRNISRLYFTTMEKLGAIGLRALYTYLTERLAAALQRVAPTRADTRLNTNTARSSFDRMLVYDVFAAIAYYEAVAAGRPTIQDAPGYLSDDIPHRDELLPVDLMRAWGDRTSHADSDIRSLEHGVGIRLPTVATVKGYRGSSVDWQGTPFTYYRPTNIGVVSSEDSVDPGVELPDHDMDGGVLAYNARLVSCGKGYTLSDSPDGMTLRFVAGIQGTAGGRPFTVRLEFTHTPVLNAQSGKPDMVSCYVAVDEGSGWHTVGPRYTVGQHVYWPCSFEIPMGDSDDVELTFTQEDSDGLSFGTRSAYGELLKYEIPEIRPVDDSPPPPAVPPDAPVAIITGSRRPWPEARYTSGLEGVPGSEWSLPDGAEGQDVPVMTTDSTDRCMGPFGNQVLTLTLKDIPKHTQLVVGLEFFVMGPWEGSSAAEPHILQVHCVRGVVRDKLWDASVATVPSSKQTYPNRAYTAAVNAGGTDADARGTLYHDVPSAVYVAEFSVAHTEDSVVLEIGAKNLPDDCTWGLARTYVKPSFNYRVNEAFDAARFPAPLISPRDIPAIVVGRSWLGDGFESDLVFVNARLPVTLYTDGSNEVRRLRFPVFGTPADVDRFWQQAEARFSSSPARVFDLRADRVGFATPDDYPKTLNPMAVMLGHVMGGNLLILKLSAYGDSIPVSVFNDLRRRLPVSCGLLLHTEIGVQTESTVVPGDITVFDAVFAEDNVPVVGNPYLRLWGPETGEVALRTADGTALDAGTWISLQTGETKGSGDFGGAPEDFVPATRGFQWWQHSDTPMIIAYRGLTPGQLTISVWPAMRREVTAYVLLGNADLLGIRVPDGGVADIENGVLRLTVTRDALTELKDFVIRWAVRTSGVSEEPVVAGYME